MSFAKIEVLGNLGADPETKYTPNGAMVVELRLAVNDYRKPDDPPVWYRVSAWDRLAERLDKLAQAGSLQKGYSIIVEGYFAPREYTAQDGTQRVSYDITAFTFDFAGSGRRDQNGNGQQQERPQQQASPAPRQPAGPLAGFDPNDIPF